MKKNSKNRKIRPGPADWGLERDRRPAENSEKIEKIRPAIPDLADVGSAEGEMPIADRADAGCFGARSGKPATHGTPAVPHTLHTSCTRPIWL